MTFDPTNLVGLHTVVSLLALACGLVLIAALLRGHTPGSWTAGFVAATVATDLTGFLLPAPGFLPSHAFGILSLAATGLAAWAFWHAGLAGGWRKAFAVAVVFATYLDAFVAVVQVFQKVPAANALAPTQSEPPFVVAMAALLVAAVVLGILAARRPREG